MAAPATAVRIAVVAAQRFNRLAPKRRNLSFSLSPKRRYFTCKALQKPSFVVKEQGEPETLDYRVFFHDSSGKKIPRRFVRTRWQIGWVTPLLEVVPRSLLLPLLYRFRYNINWNYGLLPQTWEDPYFANAEIEGAFGDNDPVDVVEIGDTQAKIGDVLKVKPLGALAMIDEGELDWKIIAISLDDPKASLVNDVNDVDTHFPGTLTAIRDWFRDYKIPDGKPANKFGLGNKAANKDYAMKVIMEANEAWAKLVKRSIPAGELSLV